MIPLERHASLGSALRAALERWADHVCLIEADRDRENARLTYADFARLAHPLAAALQARGFAPGDRAAIVMTNQSKWLVSAYALLHAGGVLVPVDYKLAPAEQRELVRHAGARLVITEWPIWRALAEAGGFAPGDGGPAVVVTEAPPGADLRGALRWEALRADREPAFVARARQDPACIVYSSGTAGRPKGCVLTHDNYLEQCAALTALFPFRPGVRYLSILPTNHAIDFMVGFIGPFVCGATVVHLRTLRPEWVRDAFTRYRITHVTLVPMILKNLERGLRERLAALPPARRAIVRALVAINRALTRDRPRVAISRRLLRPVHEAFGGALETIFVGGAFSDPAMLQFFYDLGIPVANGYGLTEACTAVALNDLRPFRPDTVGRPLPGIDVRILDPDEQGVGQIAVRGRTVMAHYLDDPELTSRTIVDGWLLTGDLGRFDRDGHLQIVGRVKNMIVTEGGKNVYPEDVEAVFEGGPGAERAVFAAAYLWPGRARDERLVLVVGVDRGGDLSEADRAELAARNLRLAPYKRVAGLVVWREAFPRTASMKIRREALAEQIRARLGPETVVAL
ncbi:MAG TPA: AMP-binding protein [Vicinamibacterales bacterium]|nr:AMP-binding protein [Vicinamibacterales bacterium]